MSVNWHEGLTEKDWLFDGSPIRGTRMLDRFAHLDWSKAWVDLGPSVAGNPGPYWHVPLHYENDETVHRLYPKMLTSKWLPVIRRACEEIAEKSDPERLAADKKVLQLELATARIRIMELERALTAAEGHEK